MERRRLGRTDLTVSALCLGNMTWGSQNTEAEAHAQIERALAAGCDFIDTAEMYPTTPHHPTTSGDSERLTGSWFAKTGRRHDVVVATKVVGEGYRMIRDGAPISAETIRAACEASLQKLQTDYIDLYQLHWPNRGSYHFRQYWDYDPSTQDATQKILDDLEESLLALDALVKAGKVRHVGVSNDTAWGVMRLLEMAERRGLPRIASIQNEYSLLCRLFDTDLAETSAREQVGLLCYSPLAGGILTGKYRGGATPPGSRQTINPGIGGRMTARAMEAVEGYAAIAERHGLNMAQMALAWAMSRPFMTSVIFGATSLEQLDVALGAAELRLSDEVMTDIAEVHRRIPQPC